MGKGVLEPTYRKRIGYQAMLLGGMATLASALLVIGDLRTRDVIAERFAEDLKASLSQVIPAEVHHNDLTASPLVLADGRTVYRAIDAQGVSAVAFESSAEGYAGPILCLLGIDRNGELLGVRVLKHTETPGLGDKIEIARDNWILDFDGRSLQNLDEKGWAVKKDGGVFDQFTGATITPRAVVKAVHEGLLTFNQHRDEWLQAPEENAPEEKAPEQESQP